MRFSWESARQIWRDLHALFAVTGSFVAICHMGLSLFQNKHLLKMSVKPVTISAWLLLMTIFANNILITQAAPFTGFIQSVSTSVIAAPFAIDSDILHKDAFVYYTNSYNFDLQAFLNTQPGPLKNSLVKDGTTSFRASEAISSFAGYSGLDIKMLLSFLETRYQLLSNPSSSVEVLGGTLAFNDYLTWLGEELNAAFYNYVPEEANYYVFQNGTKVAVPAGTTAPTYAIFNVLAATVDSIIEWQPLVTAGGYKTIYAKYFGAINLARPSSTPTPTPTNTDTRPEIKFPWTEGEAWVYTQGPHAESSKVAGLHAIDLAPGSAYNVDYSNLCVTTSSRSLRSSKHLRAPLAGTVVAVNLTSTSWRFITIAGTNSNWQVRLTHFVPDSDLTHALKVGSTVQQGQKIGYPSNCGHATGVHIHLSTLFKGQLQPIENTKISGWTIKGQKLNSWLEKPSASNPASVVQIRVGSAVVSDNKENVPVLPAKPTNFSIDNTLSNQVKLSWLDNATNEAGFLLERKLGIDGTWELAATVGANVTTYTDVNLLEGTDYFYRVQAFNNAGASAFTEQIKGTTTLFPNISSTIKNADGTLELFTRGSDNGLWTKKRLANGSWGEWQSLGGGMLDAPTVARNLDGTLEVFITGLDNKLWSKRKLADGSWSDWQQIPGITFKGRPVVSAKQLAGSIEIFVLGSDNAYWAIRKLADGSWSSWTSLGGYLKDEPGVAYLADGSLELFGRGSDDGLWSIKRAVSTGVWDSWQSLSGKLSSPVATGYNPDGSLEVCAKGEDNSVWCRKQLASGIWEAWYTLGGKTSSSPVLANNADSTLQLFVRGTYGKAIWSKRKLADGSWPVDWQSLGGGLTSTPEVILNSNGTLEVFARGLDNVIWHTYQLTPNSTASWSDWFSLQ